MVIKIYWEIAFSGTNLQGIVKSMLDHYDGGAGGNSIMAKTSRLKN